MLIYWAEAYIILKIAEALVVGSKETRIQVNADKTKYTGMSRDQNARRSHNIKTDNSSFERMKQFKYLGTTLTNQNFIQEEIKSRLKSGNACYHSVRNLLSSSLLYKNLKINIYRTMILPVVLYGCKSWSLTLRKERRLRVSEKRALRRIFGSKMDETGLEWRRLHNEELNDLYCSPNTIRVIKSRRMRRTGHVALTGERRVAYRIFVGNHEGKRSHGRPSRRWEENINMDLQEVGWGEWTELIWPRIGTGGGHL